MPEYGNYKGREQSFLKHYVLKNYLQKLTYKVALGSKKSTFVLTYIDGFSGPWQSQTLDNSDTSFQIAINELRTARNTLTSKGINLRIRCLFVEKEPQPFHKLEEHLRGINDIQIELICGKFEENINQVIAFARSDNNMFTFTFIDPTGWTGFGMKAIKPLLKLNRSEVLINFMTKDIIRFIDDERPDIKATFIDLFGSFEVQKLWADLRGKDREETIVSAYRQRLKEEAGFQYVADAIILNPEKDRTHFHLIYGTRHLDGLLVFKNVEERAMFEQNKVRNIAKQNSRIDRTQNLELFSAEETSVNDYFEDLRIGFLTESKKAIVEEIRKYSRILYDDLLCFLEMPMTYEKDLKKLLTELQRNGQIEILRLDPRARVPKKGLGHTVIWKG